MAFLFALLTPFTDWANQEGRDKESGIDQIKETNRRFLEDVLANQDSVRRARRSASGEADVLIQPKRFQFGKNRQFEKQFFLYRRPGSYFGAPPWPSQYIFYQQPRAQVQQQRVRA